MSLLEEIRSAQIASGENAVVESLMARGLIPRPTAKDYLTTKEWVLNDPEVTAPPTGVLLLVVNPGGVLHKSLWYEGAIAWGPLPTIPQSVKDRWQAKI